MDETTIDLREVVAILKKRKWFIVKVFLAFTVAALVMSFIIPPTYEAETTLRVKQSKGIGDSLLASLPSGNALQTKQLMSTYQEIIKSRTVVQEVIDTTQTDKEELPYYEDMLKRIDTQSVRDTEIMNVKVRAKSPEEAQYVANALVEVFLNRLTNLVRSEQSLVREFIGERLAESKGELEKAENALEQYKQQQQIAAPDEETQSLVESMAAIDKLAAENKVNLAAAQAKLTNANKELGNEKPGFIADNLVIQQYKKQLAELEVQRAQLSSDYTDKNPKVIAVKEAIAEIRDKLDDEIANVVSANGSSINPVHQGLMQARIQSEAEVQAYSAQKQIIDTILAEGDNKLAELPEKEKGLVRVTRDANVAQEIYIMLAKRYEEARISEVMAPTDVQVIDEAVTPDKPVSPKKLLNTVIGAILGLFIGIGLAFAKEYMNRTIVTAADVTNYLGLAILGSIPDFDNEAKRQQSSSFMNRLNGLFWRKRDFNKRRYKI